MKHHNLKKNKCFFKCVRVYIKVSHCYELLVNAKDKKLHQVYKGLSTNVVKEAFGWNDEFKTV